MSLEKDKLVKYEYVDVESLSSCLAEDAWKNETKDFPDEELHETVVLPGGETMRQIQPRWARSFFNLRESFLRLIHEFVKP